MSSSKASRIELANDCEMQPENSWVLYWMTSARRTRSNYGLQRALMLAEKLKKPLVVLEALRCEYLYASDRFHAFVLQGMADNASTFGATSVEYYPYVELAPDQGKGLLAAMAEKSCCVVADRFPTYFLRSMVPQALAKLKVKCEIVDSNGILPLAASPKAYGRAYDYRRFLQKTLPTYIDTAPHAVPLNEYDVPACPQIPEEITQRWPRATKDLLLASPSALAALPIDHSVAPVEPKGGSISGTERLEDFVFNKLDSYQDDRNHPDRDGASGLAPYLHFGHVGAWQVLETMADRLDWLPNKLAETTTGGREGWWGMPPSFEAFADQVFCWRELGYHFCNHIPDHAEYDTLPEWAKKSLAEHASDERKAVFSVDELDRAATYDEVWNAAQRQLKREGRIHNYMRMVWGKRIIEWTESPREALRVMLHLNDRYALDGRDPNSISGITWCLGRFDRAWGPERPIYGKIRFMSSENTKRKLHANEYLAQYGPGRA